MGSLHEINLFGEMGTEFLDEAEEGDCGFSFLPKRKIWGNEIRAIDRGDGVY